MLGEPGAEALRMSHKGLLVVGDDEPLDLPVPFFHVQEGGGHALVFKIPEEVADVGNGHTGPVSGMVDTHGGHKAQL